MSQEPTLTLTGNLHADPTLRYTANGKAVASGRLACTPSKWDRDQGKNVDGETLWMSFSLWGKPAERLAASARKGDRLIVTGKLKARSYQQQGGDTRTVQELEAEDVGMSVMFNEVTSERRAAQGGSAYQRPSQAGQQPMEDPWGSAPAPDDGSFPDDQEPAF